MTPEYIKGIIQTLEPTSLVIEDLAGHAYKLGITKPTYESLQDKDLHQPYQIYTYFYWNQEEWVLFGFSDISEKKIFQIFMKTQGVSAKMTHKIFTQVHYTECMQMILTEDVTALTKLPGVGKKTAERMIIDIKDSLQKLIPTSSQDLPSISKSQPQSHKEDAKLALLGLGFEEKKIASILQEIEKNSLDFSLEEYIREALKMLAAK